MYQSVSLSKQAEQGRIAEKTSHTSSLTLDDLNEMPYASKVVKESLRMASIVAWLPRVALQDCEVQGWFFNCLEIYESCHLYFQM